MDAQEELIQVLRRIEENQLKSLDMQAEHVKFAREQMERAHVASESAQALQRAAMSRVQRISMFIFPVTLLLIALVVYICVKWRII